MSKTFFILVFGLLFVGFVSGAEETISVIVLEKDVPQMMVRSMTVSGEVELPRERIGYEFSNVGGFSAEVTISELETLRRDPSKKVFIDKIYHTNLDVSVPLINVDDVWNLKIDSLNATGSGQTVCVIDTGVNYNHTAFGNCYGNNDPASSCKVIGGYDFVNNDDYPLDDAGHGTHVTGIIASGDSTYKGTSPDVKIISIKALDNTGSGSGADIIAGIEWCVNNASKFNISVISMSLGDNSTYNTYCNDNYFASFIDNAVDNGISVVVSAGNCDLGDQTCTDGVAVPACVESAIIAGAVDDADSISGADFMRGSLLELMAPGVNIMSTLYNGGFGNKSGTSMSAPHISGTIALINQYLDLSGQTRTPAQIEDMLNDTGVVLNDTAGSGYYFSRIDAYSAIISLDVDAPNVMLVSPADDNIDADSNQTFVCNASDWQLANMTLSVWNSSGLYYNVSGVLTGIFNSSSFDLADMSSGVYTWNCLGVDALGNSGYSVSNYSLTIGGISTTLLSPVDGKYSNVNATNFSCRVIADASNELSNVTFEIWNSSGNLIYNLTEDVSGFDNTTVFNYSFADDGNYSWNCLGINNVSDSSFGASNFSFVYDSVVPSLVLTSLPTGETSNSVSKIFGFNVSDDNLANCSLIVDGIISSTNSSVNVSLGQSFSRVFTPGTYAWRINCSDFAGNVNGSSENSFVITAPAVAPSFSSSGGGGGGGSSVSASSGVYKVSVSEITVGYTKKLKKNDKVNFSIFDYKGGRHLLIVENVEIDYVDLVIESEPVKLRLGIGQSARLNLTSSYYYDLFVKLNSIVDGVAELTIQLINEPIEEKVVEVVREEVVETEVEVIIDYFWVVLVLVGVLVLVVLVVVRRRKGKKTKELKSGKGKKKDGKGKKIKT